MGRQYFLQDKELENADHDFFQHRDIAANIGRILSETPPPYNIAVIGKWGLGKSSLINLATQEAKNRPDEYSCIRINAWKYEKEALSKVFLRQVMESLDESKERTTQQEKVKKHFKDIIHIRLTENEAAVRAPIKEFWKRYGRIFLIYILITFVIYAFYKRGVLALDNTLKNKGLIEYAVIVLTGYLRNFASLIALPALIGVLEEIKENIKKSQNRQVLQIPEMNVEDYEIELQRTIRNQIEEKGKKDDFKIIIILEDLDRLSIEKMVEALDAIKMFINFPNCIFIVPFDDSILKEALIAARIRKKGSASGTFDSALTESEQFLDKLFQYKIYLSPLLNYDIKKYAEKLCRENLKDFFVEYCDEERFIRVLNRILIYPEVKTPRQVKKLVNTFISYLMLATDRERNGKVSNGFASSDEGIQMIAKLSVLQADFSDFFDLLFRRETAIEDVLDAQGDSEKIRNLPSEIRDALGMNASSDVSEQNGSDGDAGQYRRDRFPEHIRPLLNFLNYTRRFQADNLLSYLNVAMDDIVRATGTKAQQEFLKAAVSGNVDDTMLLLQETPQLASAAVEFINRKDDILDVINMVFCLSHLMDIEGLIEDVNKREIADAIAERAAEMVSTPEEIDPEQICYKGLLICYELTDNKEELAKLLNLLLACELGESKDARVVIRTYLDYREILSEETDDLLQSYIQKTIREHWIETDDMIAIRQEYQLDSEIWISDLFRLLINTIEVDKELSGKRSDELGMLFKLLARTKYNETFMWLTPLYGEPFMTRLFLTFLDLQSEKVELDISIASELIKAQVSGADDNISEINKMLTKCRYIVDEEWVKTLDDYLQGQAGIDEMWDILDVYSDENSLEMLPLTIKAVIDDAFTNRNEIKTDCIANMLALGEDSVSKAVFAKLKAAVAYTSDSGYEYIPKLLNAYAKVDPDNIHKLIQTNITSMKLYIVTKDVLGCYAEYLVVAMKENREKFEDLTAEFLDLVDMKLTKGQVLNSCITAYWKLCDYVSDERFRKAEPELFKAKNPENCADLYTLFVRKKDLFMGEDALNIQHLNSICCDAIEYTSLKTQAVETLRDFFSWIEDIPKLAILIRNAGKENIDYNIAYATLNKFISNKIVAGKARADAVRNLFKMIEEIGSDFVNEFLEDRVEIIHCVIQIVSSGPDSFSYEEVAGLIGWIVDVVSPENGIQPLVSEMLMVLLNKSSTEEQYLALTEIMESLSKENLRKKKTYLPIFISLLTKTSSGELRKRIILLARKCKLNRDVLDQAPASMSEELEQYLREEVGK